MAQQRHRDATLTAMHARLVALVNELDTEPPTVAHAERAFHVLEPLIYDLGNVVGIPTDRKNPEPVLCADLVFGGNCKLPDRHPGECRAGK